MDSEKKGENLSKKALDEVIPSDNSDKDVVRMKRTIGVFGGVAMIIGMMIGSGIFVTPMTLLEKTGSTSLSLVVWAVCGLVATLAALTYIELGTIVPKSGGEHAYLQATFPPLNKYIGELPGFLYAWVTVLLIRPSGLTIASLAFGKYALYPILKMDKFCKEFQDEDDFKLATQLLAVAVASLITAINIISATLASRAAILFLISKVSTMVIMIGIGVYNMGQGEFGELSKGWDPSNKTIGDIAISFYSGLFAYDGWGCLNYAIEELVDPYRTLPLSIIIGIPMATLLYILINVSYLTVLTKEEMIASEAVAIDVGDEYLGPMKLLIPILVCVAAFGTGHANAFMAGRITYSTSRDGHMIDVMSYVHATRLTPVVALCYNVIISYIMIFASDIGELIELLGFAGWIFYGLSLGCVIILRFTMPDAPRPFRVPILIPIISVIFSIGLVVIPFVYDPKIGYLIVLGYFLLGVVIYIPLVYYKYRPPFMDKLTHIIQYMTVAVPSPYKED